MFKHCLIAGALAVAAGCGGGGGRSTVAQPAGDRARLMASLRVVGTWGEPANGVRARMLVDRSELQETQAVLAAVELENVGPAAVELENASRQPVDWQAAGVGLDSDQAIDPSASKATLSLAPGQTFVTPPSEVLIPPGPPKRQLAAQFMAKGSSIVVPPIELTVSSAEWGQAVAGLRIRVSTGRDEYGVGEKAVLRIFFHNVSNQPLTIHRIDDDSQDVDTRRDLLTFKFKTLDTTTRQLAAGGVATHAVSEPLLLAPGAYRLRVVVDSKELSIDHPSAWHGRAVSNDFPLRIQ